MARRGRWPQGRWCAGDDETATATRGVFHQSQSVWLYVRVSVYSRLSAEIDIGPYSVAAFLYLPYNREIKPVK